MPPKARPSVLNLFDPLLAGALHVPLPDTPPLSPRYQDQDENDGETEVPNDAMTLFFNRFMQNSKTIPYTKPEIGLLVNIEEDTETIDIQNPSMTPQKLVKQPLLSLQASPCLTSASAERTQCTYDPVIPPLLVVSESTAESPNVLLEEKEPTLDSQVVNDGYSSLSLQSHSRRRSSIDIPRTLSSFSSGLLELPGSNFDLIQEELSLLSAFSEEGEGDTFQDLLNKIELPTPPVTILEDVTSPAKSTLSTPIPAAFEMHLKVSEELSIPETGADHQKEYPQTHLNEGSYHAVDASDYQHYDSKDSRTPPKISDIFSNSQTTAATLAPKRPKVFTLNRQHMMFKPNPFLKSVDKLENIGNDSSKPASSLTQTRMMPLEDSDSGNIPVRTIPRLQKAPSVKQVIAPESKIPSRVTTQTDGSNCNKSTPIPRTFGGASRIAMPLKKGLRRT